MFHSLYTRFSLARQTLDRRWNIKKNTWILERLPANTQESRNFVIACNCYRYSLKWDRPLTMLEKKDWIREAHLGQYLVVWWRLAILSVLYHSSRSKSQSKSHYHKVHDQVDTSLVWLCVCIVWWHLIVVRLPYYFYVCKSSNEI